MKILKLTAKNIFCFEQLEVNFVESSITQLIGNNLDEGKIVNAEDGMHSSANGVGKSSIYYIITEALYSKNHSKIKKSFIGNMYIKGGFEIILTLEIENELHTLYYSDKDSYVKKGEDILVKGRKNVSDFFEALIPFDLFMSITYMSPEYKIPYFSDTDKYKKEFIKLIFDDLNKYTEPFQALKKEFTTTTSYKSELQGKLEVLDSKRKEVILPLKPVPKLEFPTFNIDKMSDIKEQIFALKTRQKANQDAKNKEEKLRSELDSIKSQLDIFNGIIEPDEDTFTAELIGINTEIKRLEPLNGKSACPTCNRPVDIDKFKSHREGLGKRASEINEKLALHESQVREWKKFVNTREKYQKLSEEIQLLPKISADEKIVEEISVLENKLKELTLEYNYLQEEYERKEGEVESILKFNQTQEVKKLLADEAEVDYQTVLAELTTINQRLLDLKILIDTFSDEGIIQSKLPERLALLNREVNKELQKYTNQFSLVFKVSNGKIVETLYKDQVEYPIENCSTGEKTRVNLGLLFATRKILRKLKGIECNLLFFDEIFGSLDAFGRTSLLERLKTLDANSYIISQAHFSYDFDYIEIIKHKNISTATLYKAEQQEIY